MRRISIFIATLGAFMLSAQKKDSIKTRQIEEIVFQKKGVQRSNDITKVSVKAREAAQIASVSGGIEGLIKTLPSVNSNTELSSQYMVRGGNFDENLIYINDVEVYRPFLVRNSVQEGLSIINPDMVAAVNFSAGGFEAKYGDRMSSSLNIYYREPQKFELQGEASLIGGRLTTGWASKNKQLTTLVSARYRNTNLILNTLRENTNFNPVYSDLQAYLNYHISPQFSISFLGYLAHNAFDMVPKEKTVEFGTLLRPVNVNIGYAGRENDRYRNMMGTVTALYKPNRQWRISLDAYAYQNREREYFSIASGYQIERFDPITGDPVASYDLGAQIDHARNDLMQKIMGTNVRVRFSPNSNTDIEAGLRYDKEFLQDHTNEWRLIEDQGYNIPRIVIPGVLDNSPLSLYYHIYGDNKIRPTRMSAYAQYAQKFMLGTSKAQFNGGVRVANWSFNNETIVSPRVQFALKPDWNADMLFRLAGGIYYQQPNYREIKDLTGGFNANIQSQLSIQAILGMDYEYEWQDRPFKLTTELYYKKMDRLIPYFMDNVRIRYAGVNNATGVAYGIDTRLFGEFVTGVDSWLSLSYARAFENLEGRGNIPRATDQRLRFALFYQDYMPNFPKMRVNLTGIYAMGLPTGSPLIFDGNNHPDMFSRYQVQSTLPSYKRVDIGLAYVFIDAKDKRKRWGFWSNFRDVSLGVQVFNAFNIYNTVANQWITDVTNQLMYPVPVNLTGRFFNVKLDFLLK